MKDFVILTIACLISFATGYQAAPIRTIERTPRHPAYQMQVIGSIRDGARFFGLNCYTGKIYEIGDVNDEWISIGPCIP